MATVLSPSKLFWTAATATRGGEWFRLARSSDGILCLESISDATLNRPGPPADWGFVAEVPRRIATQLADDDAPDQVAKVLDRAVRVLVVTSTVSDTEPRNDDFDRAYRELADVGSCDEPGGAEYERVHEEWVSAGRPDGIRTFIRERANTIPQRAEVGMRVVRTRKHQSIPVGMGGTINIVHPNGILFQVVTDDGGFNMWTSFCCWQPESN